MKSLLVLSLLLLAAPASAQTSTLAGGCAEGLQPDAHTVALYKFDEALPGTSLDASGNGLNATDYGTTVVEGRFCNARRFNGESDRIDIDVVRQALQGQTAWTIEYIARSENGSQVPQLVNHVCGSGWWLGPRGTVIRFSIKTTVAGGNCLWTVGEAFAEAELDTLWHYYAMTWDGDSLRVYRDGAYLDARPASGVFQQNQSSGFRAWIGHSDYGTQYTAGLADELRISGVARSAAEIFDTAVALGFAESSVSAEEGAAPRAFALHAPYPNPFADQATLAFDLPQPTMVRLAVFDALGREMAVLVEGKRAAGRHEAVIDAAGLPGGAYFVRIEAGTFAATQRMVLVR